MYYQGDELIKLMTAFQATNLHENERQRIDRTALQNLKQVSNPAQNPVSLLHRSGNSAQRATPELGH